MTDLEGRALRKRIDLPSHFSHPVVVEAVTVHEDAALVRVKRPDGGLEDVTLDVVELEQALDRATAAAATLVSGIDMRHALEAVRIRLSFASSSSLVSSQARGFSQLSGINQERGAGENDAG